MVSEDRRFPLYLLFSPPAQLADRQPREWKPSEARMYFQWFLKEIPNRIRELRKVIEGSEPSIATPLDFSPDSLRPLGEWFSSTIEVRQREPDEIERELASLPEKARRMGVQDWTLTSESLSIAVDTGIYLGEVLARRFPGLQWSLKTHPRSDVSYNQPVLETRAIKVDPINLAVVLGYGVARGSRGPDDLHKLYHVWADRVSA
jgi:hypothetical protein